MCSASGARLSSDQAAGSGSPDSSPAARGTHSSTWASPSNMYIRQSAAQAGASGSLRALCTVGPNSSGTALCTVGASCSVTAFCTGGCLGCSSASPEQQQQQQQQQRNVQLQVQIDIEQDTVCSISVGSYNLRMRSSVQGCTWVVLEHEVLPWCKGFHPHFSRQQQRQEVLFYGIHEKRLLIGGRWAADNRIIHHRVAASTASVTP